MVWPEMLPADLNKEAGIVDFLDPTALQGFQVPVGGWAQQVQILHVYFEVLQLLLQLGSVLREGGGQGEGMPSCRARIPELLSLVRSHQALRALLLAIQGPHLGYFQPQTVSQEASASHHSKPPPPRPSSPTVLSG